MDSNHHTVKNNIDFKIYCICEKNGKIMKFDQVRDNLKLKGEILGILIR
jgi:hypothetical protein